MPIIPVTILSHKVWVFVDSGATFTILNIDAAKRIGIDWQTGRTQMIVVGDRSYIPAYFHNLSLQIGDCQITLPSAFPSDSESASISSDAPASSINSKFASTTARAS
jgi:hypothetical protein